MKATRHIDNKVEDTKHWAKLIVGKYLFMRQVCYVKYLHGREERDQEETCFFDLVTGLQNQSMAKTNHANAVGFN